MPLVFSLSSIISSSSPIRYLSYDFEFSKCDFRKLNYCSNLCSSYTLPCCTSLVAQRCNTSFSKNLQKESKFIVQNNAHMLPEDSGVVDDWGDFELGGDMEDEGTPWEGAIIYKRNASVSHVEYCTTLERLGLGKLSSEVSKSRAAVMGLRVTKAVKEYTDGTPVLISLDVTRKKQKLRLDGIIRTVITLGCNRCGEPAAEGVFSNFSLLLTEEPIKEPETINLGTIFGQDKYKSFGSSEEEVEDDDASIDIDDQLYFPPEQKVIDISKHIRDLLHVEITISAICSPMCKGLCLRCGTNLNFNTCNCETQKVQEKGYGPLGDLKRQMQQQ